MISSLFGYAEPSLQWWALHRYRPDAGLAYEKHAWRVGPSALFEHAGTLVARDVYVRQSDALEVPAAIAAAATSSLRLSRVVLAGDGVDAVLAQLLAGRPGLVASPSASSADGLPQATPVAGSMTDTCRILLNDPRAYLLADPRPTPGRVVDPWPLSLQQLQWLRDLGRGAFDLVSFAKLVASAQWIATSLGAASESIGAIAVYGTEDVLAATTAAAKALGREIQWGAQPPSVPSSSPRHRDLPRGEDLTTGSASTLDLRGYNVAEVPDSPASEVLLDDTAIVDVHALGSWQQLVTVSAGRLRLRSLAPLGRVRRLALGFLDRERLDELAALTAVEQLTVSGSELDDLRAFGHCASLRSLELHDVEVSSLRGLEQLPGLVRLEIHGKVPPDLGELAHLRNLRELSVHAIDDLDAGALPPLPSLERLALCGHQGRPIALRGAETLRRYHRLRALALRTTDVTRLDWIGSLSALRDLDLAATDVVDASPLGALSDLRRLDLSQSPATDLSVLGRLGQLEDLDVSFAGAFDASLFRALPRLSRLVWRGAALRSLRDLGGQGTLRVCDLGGGALSSLDGAAHLPALEELDVGSTAVTELGPLRQHLALRQLRAPGCRISSIDELATLPSLTDLDLSAAVLADLGPLAGCSRLQDVTIDDLTAADLQPLTGLALRSLRLAGATLNDVSALSALSELRRLDLSRSSLPSFDFAPALRRLRELRVGSLPLRPPAEPLLQAPPLARLELDSAYLRSALGPQLRARHHVFPVGE